MSEKKSCKFCEGKSALYQQTNTTKLYINTFGKARTLEVECNPCPPHGVAAVIFEDGKFGVKWGWHSELVALTGFANTSVEIIGNCHDNPELLKGEDLRT